MSSTSISADGRTNSLIRWLPLAALAMLLAKLYCAATTVGTLDVYLYYKYGRTVALGGLASLYQMAGCNLTPIQGWFAAWVYRMSPDDIVQFACLLKLPGILAHFAATGAILWASKIQRSASPAVLFVFVLSPISFMVDGFHGNLDSVMTCLMFVSAIFCARGSLFCSALFLALAAQIKISALLIGPILAFRFINGRFVLFCLHVGWITLLGLLPGILSAPGQFLTQVLNYGSNFGVWGFPYLLRLTGAPDFQPMHWASLTESERLVGTVLKLVIVFTVCWIGWSRRKLPPGRIFESIAYAWTIFFAFAPGFGIQYLVWAGPFLALTNRRWFGVYITTVSVAAFFYYDIFAGGMPWYGVLDGISDTWAAHMLLHEWGLLLPWSAALIGATLILRNLIGRASTIESSDGPVPQEEPKSPTLSTPAA